MSLGVLRDSRFAVRMLLGTPGFSLVALLTFALGIGVNAAVFTVYNGVLLRPLPYPDADRITMVWMDNRRERIKEDITSWPNYMDWRSQNSSFAHLAGFTAASFNLTGAGDPERLRGAQATANFFDVIGVKPVLGQVFTEKEETPGNDGVIVLSYGLWQRRFGGASDVVGKTMTLNGRAFQIIGVMPAGLDVPEKTELWKPLAPDANTRSARNAFWLPVIGRLKPGISVEQAQTEMNGIGTRIEQTYPEQKGFGVYVVSLHRQIVGDIERPLTVLLGAVGFVLLIACANLGNLMLGRSAARRKELAIRTALGAGRWRLVRQMVTETCVLAFAGSLLGLLLAYWTTDLFIGIGGGTIPRPDVVRIDGRVIAFALAMAALAAILAGVVPAVQTSGGSLADPLKEGGRDSGTGGSRRTRDVLIAVEVALAFMLLAGAGLLARTLWTMQQVDRGFRTDHIASMAISLPPALFATADDVRTFQARLLERTRTLPGVEAAAFGTQVLQPLITNSGVFSVEGQPYPPPEQRIEYPTEVVSPGFFETVGIRLAEGRFFTAQDTPQAPLVIVVNETLAKQTWPGQSPLGRKMKPGPPDGQGPWFNVVGVIKDARRADLRRQIRPEIYFCSLQGARRTMTLYVRTSGDPMAIVPAIRSEVRAIHPQVPLFAVSTLDTQMSESLAQPRFSAVLLGGFALLALVLASIGIYGVTSYAVSQRRREMGVRMALGAKAVEVLSLILRQHLVPALIGVAIGIAGALAVSRFLESLVYGVGTTDALTFVTVGLVLLAVAALAAYIPARRATRVDPLIALRAE
jgi:putative ABC transport system permease protein